MTWYFAVRRREPRTLIFGIEGRFSHYGWRVYLHLIAFSFQIGRQNMAAFRRETGLDND